jgi:hypothetical protein
MYTLIKRRENRRSRGQGMSPTKTIYVFRCAESGLYAFTADPEGHLLPSRIYPLVSWRLDGRLTLWLDRNSPRRDIVKAMLNAIVKDGFQLAHAAVDTELFSFTAQYYAEDIEPQNEVRVPSDSP